MAGIEGRTRSKGHVVEEFKPSSGWLEDLNCHYLLVDLPDFNKEEIKIQTDSADHVTVSGQRLVKDKKYIYFEETFKVPENSDIQLTSGRLEDGLLTVTVPKRLTPLVEKEETQHHEQDLSRESQGYAHKPPEGEAHKPPESEARGREPIGEFALKPPESEARGRKTSGECLYSDEIIKKWGEERTVFRIAMKMLNRNRGVILTAVLAFSLGVWVSGKFNLGGHEKALE